MAYDLGTARGKIELTYDGKDAADKADKDIDRTGKKSEDTDGKLKKLGATLKGLFTGVKLGALAVAMSNAAVQAAAFGIQILGIIPALASILSLSSALPAIYVGIIAATSILKAAFAGVGDAVKAAFDTESPEKFQEALKKLSPEAQKFALAVQKSVPQLKAFQQAIQDTFFRSSALAGALPRVVKAMQELRPGVLALTGDFGEITRKVQNFALSADSITFVANSIGAFRAALSEVTPAILPILAGLREVGGVGTSLMVRLAENVGRVALAFGNWLQDIAADGRLKEWIQQALETLRTLGDIVKNVGSILFDVISAASESGGGLLNVIKEITGQFAAFLNSAEGSAAIRDLFSGIMALAKQLSPILTTLVKVLAGALGPALVQIATTLGPALLQVVNNLAPAFGPLIAALADLITAVAPLLVPLSKLVALLAGVLATAISNIVAEFGPLIDVIAGALTEAFTAFGPIVAEMAKGLPLAAKAGIQLAAAFAPLAPAVIELAQALSSALLAVMPQLLASAEELIPVFVQFAAVLTNELIYALRIITPLIPVLVQAFAKVLPILLFITTAGIRLVTWILEFVQAIRNFIPVVAEFAKALAEKIGNALVAAYDAVVVAGAAVIQWFQDLPGRIVSALKALPALLLAALKAPLEQAAVGVGAAAGLIVGFFTRLVPQIASAINSIPGLLARIFIAAGTAMYRAVVSAGTSVYNFFQALPRRIRGALSALGSLLSSVFRSAMNAARTAVSNGANAVYSFFRNLPNRIRGALGSLSGTLTSAGRNVVSGLLRGIQNMAGRVLDYVRGLAHKVRDAFNSALSIFSPSRDFFDSGVNIGKGLIGGLKNQLKGVTATAKILANATIQPTLALPPAVAAAMNRMVPTYRSFPVAAMAASVGTGQQGPYTIQVGDKPLVEFVVDTVTGHPRVISKAAQEGDRQDSFNGSGRRAL